MKVRAALLREMGLSRPYAESRPVAIEEVELDPPGPDEVLVKVAAAGLCHSDLSVINGARPRAMPMVLGHEAAGIVEELGAGVDDFAVGDHVVMIFVPSCGHCLPCMAGRPALCQPGATANAAGTLLSGARRLHFDGKDVNHQVGVSCFAERAVLDRHSLVKIDKELPLEEAALFGCAVLTGAGAVLNTAGTPAGATVAIVGLGGVGLSALLAAAAIGARQIVAVDLLDSKLALARQLGASHTANASDPDCVAQIREATDGGVEFAFEMAGAVDAMDIAYRITKRGGTTVTAGLSPPEHDFQVQHVNIVAEERTIKGSYIGSCVPKRDVPRFVEMYRQGRLTVDRLLSERVGLDDLNVAFDRLADGATVRQILVP